MRHSPLFLAALITLVPASLASAACSHCPLCGQTQAGGENNVAPEGFTNLFDGKAIDFEKTWTGSQHGVIDPRHVAAMNPEDKAKYYARQMENAKQGWKVDAQKGELVSDGHHAHLATQKFYGDFEFKVDYKILKDGDSGIYLRGCPQVQIWDPSNPREVGNGAPKGSGGLWNDNGDNPGKWPLVKADSPIGEWNRMDIKMVGQRVWVTLNGKQTVNGSILNNYFDRSLPVLDAETIQLQTHGSEVRFRNIFVREIGAEEGKQMLATVTAAADAPAKKK